MGSAALFQHGNKWLGSKVEYGFVRNAFPDCPLNFGRKNKFALLTQYFKQFVVLFILWANVGWPYDEMIPRGLGWVS